MTGSSIELFPCRVQLMGLPPSTAIDNNSRASRVPPARPSMASIQRARRNLFGAPDPGARDRMLREENRRQIMNFQQRYSFDVQTTLAAASATASTDAPSAARNDAADSDSNNSLPDLISAELKQYQQRLEEGKCDVSRAQLLAETTPPQACNGKRIQAAQIRRTLPATCSGNNTVDITGDTSDSSSNIGSDRLKPYARQTLLTECFNVRKLTTAAQSNGRATTMTVARAMPRRLEVLQLPKPMQVLDASSPEPAVAAAAVTATESTNQTLSQLLQTTETPSQSLA